MSMNISRRKSLVRMAGCLSASGLVAMGRTAHAQAWPAKPVRLVVPFGAGGTTDILARAVGQAMHQATGQAWVIDSKPGAAGAIGSMEVMRQPADGYTLLFATSSTHGVSPAVTPNLGYALADFTPVGTVADVGMLLLVSPKLGVKSVRELIELAKAKPGFVNYMSNGSGSQTHLMTALLELQAGVKMTHVPYKSLPQVVPDMMSGAMHIAWDAVPSSLPYVTDGRLQALAISGARRVSALPNVPTLGEALRQMGLPGFSSSVWFALYGPKGMPTELTRRINEEVNKVLKSPDIVARFSAQGIDAVQGTPAELGALAAGDVDRWRRVVRDANIKLD